MTEEEKQEKIHTSIRLSDEAAKALEKLRQRPGGFNLTDFVEGTLIDYAKLLKS